MILRDYQERAIAAVREHYRSGRKRVLLVMATGGGKTATASALLAASVARGKRCVFVVHRREIVLDTARRLREQGLRVGVVMAGEPFDAEALGHKDGRMVERVYARLDPAALAARMRAALGGTPVGQTQWTEADLVDELDAQVVPTRDGTWHRPLTTLELAALQGLPITVNGSPLILAGNSASAWRERIGNAVPVGAASAIARHMLLTLGSVAAGRGTFSSDAVWVERASVQ